MFFLSEEAFEHYLRYGYAAVDFLTADELEILRRALEGDEVLASHADEWPDGDGRPIKMTVWNAHGRDTYSNVFMRMNVLRVAVRLIADQMGIKEFEPDQLYTLHMKLVDKPAHAGRVVTHQDYGYWQGPDYGLLNPYLVTFGVSIDDADLDNGCIQYVPGSHRCSVAPHGEFGGQKGAHPDYVDAILQRYGAWKPVPTKAGQAVIFHPCILHMSEQSTVDRRRRMLYWVANFLGNKPVVKDARHPLTKVVNLRPDNYIIEDGVRHAAADLPFLPRRKA